MFQTYQWNILRYVITEQNCKHENKEEMRPNNFNMTLHTNRKRTLIKLLENIPDNQTSYYGPGMYQVSFSISVTLSNASINSASEEIVFKVGFVLNNTVCVTKTFKYNSTISIYNFDTVFWYTLSDFQSTGVSNQFACSLECRYNLSTRLTSPVLLCQIPKFQIRKLANSKISSICTDVITYSNRSLKPQIVSIISNRPEHLPITLQWNTFFTSFENIAIETQFARTKSTHQFVIPVGNNSIRQSLDIIRSTHNLSTYEPRMRNVKHIWLTRNEQHQIVVDVSLWTAFLHVLEKSKIYLPHDNGKSSLNYLCSAVILSNEITNANTSFVWNQALNRYLLHLSNHSVPTSSSTFASKMIYFDTETNILFLEIDSKLSVYNYLKNTVLNAKTYKKYSIKGTNTIMENHESTLSVHLSDLRTSKTTNKISTISDLLDWLITPNFTPTHCAHKDYYSHNILSFNNINNVISSSSSSIKTRWITIVVIFSAKDSKIYSTYDRFLQCLLQNLQDSNLGYEVLIAIEQISFANSSRTVNELEQLIMTYHDLSQGSIHCLDEFKTVDVINQPWLRNIVLKKHCTTPLITFLSPAITCTPFRWLDQSWPFLFNERIQVVTGMLLINSKKYEKQLNDRGSKGYASPINTVMREKHILLSNTTSCSSITTQTSLQNTDRQITDFSLNIYKNSGPLFEQYGYFSYNMNEKVSFDKICSERPNSTDYFAQSNLDLDRIFIEHIESSNDQRNDIIHTTSFVCGILE